MATVLDLLKGNGTELLFMYARSIPHLNNKFFAYQVSNELNHNKAE